MASVLRMRCPCCGMLVWQDRLNRSYPFEFVRQELSSAGRGRGQIKYHRGNVGDSDASRMFQGLLALKMVEKARRLLREIDADVEIRVYGLEEEVAGVESADEEPDKIREGWREIDDWEIEYEARADLEYAAPIDFEDARWSLGKWMERRRGKRVRDLTAMPSFECEMEVDVEFEGVLDGAEEEDRHGRRV